MYSLFYNRRLEWEHEKLEQVIVNFEALGELKMKADIVFCCLGTTIKKAGSKEAFKKVDFEYPKLLALFALQIGATSFHIITAMGTNAKSNIFYNKIKGEIEEELKLQSFGQLHCYRPSLLLGERKESRLMKTIGQVVMKGLGFLFIGGLKNYKAISADKVANFMLQKSLVKEPGSFTYLSGEMQR
ncbi:MAG: oxidoreductase [Cyclobacteriaceae bacterium]|nr:oxidoreductase [Cyclobacteriaceae bacterium]